MSQPASRHTDIEREAIILNAVRAMIDDMVNHVIFVPLGDRTRDTNLMPLTSETLRQFSTLLRDFLSPVTAKSGKPLPFGLPKPPNGDRATDHTTLFYLRRIADAPLIGSDIDRLRDIVAQFTDWLEAYAFVPNVWLSNIGVELDLTIKRIDFIRMSGDIGKHNFLRLAGQARRLQTILADNGVSVDEGQAYLAIPDAWDWFHTHLFAFHASNIAEFLNNIRYAIRDYVGPIARSTFVRMDEFRYTFERPDQLIDDFSWAQYFELMQWSLSQPNYPFFTVSMSFKDQF
ncbi:MULTISPECIES: hypothetical protein [Sphingomonadaceae]|uniref:hypothetical protein n=1 Tax=Sphingomonadales TaxID=204457 RepID=UPI000DBB0F48|nr:MULTISPECIES: hypothetical protein [Sphingomonadaceae]MDG5487673.1 hypothetical protein [Sphingomonas sp. BGYR3]BBD01481.1 hypothetical protein YGS_C1P2736 [Sphingobium sp. YG1]